jgi:hypothetical protein
VKDRLAHGKESVGIGIAYEGRADTTRLVVHDGVVQRAVLQLQPFDQIPTIQHRPAKQVLALNKSDKHGPSKQDKKMCMKELICDPESDRLPDVMVLENLLVGLSRCVGGVEVEGGELVPVASSRLSREHRRARTRDRSRGHASR